MGELFMGKPMFPGDSEIGMIIKITEILGKPSSEEWPGIESQPYFKKSYPNFPPRDLKTILPDIDELGIDLL
jgi:hypothetical protein